MSWVEFCVGSHCGGLASKSRSATRGSKQRERQWLNVEGVGTTSSVHGTSDRWSQNSLNRRLAILCLGHRWRES